MSFSSGLAWSTTSPDGSILSRVCADLALERRGAAAARPRAAETMPDARRIAARASSTESRNVGERQQPQRFERAALDGERREDLRQLAEARSGKAPCAVEVARRLGRRRRAAAPTSARIGRRREPRQPLVAHRRQREAARPPRRCDRIRGPAGRLAA